jgi:hypothetical protein
VRWPRADDRGGGDGGRAFVALGGPAHAAAVDSLRVLALAAAGYASLAGRLDLSEPLKKLSYPGNERAALSGPPRRAHSRGYVPAPSL